MSELGTLANPSRPPRLFRWRKRLLLGSLIAAPLCLVVSFLYLVHSSDQALREAIAEADRLDPGWRMEDLQAKRAVIPDEQNAALIIMAAQTRLPSAWRNLDLSVGAEQGNPFWKVEQPVQLDERQVNALREDLQQAQEVLTELRKVVRLPTGRFPKPVLLGTLRIGRLLAYEVLLQAQEKDVDGALTTCHAILNCGRACGDEPGPIALLVRALLTGMATHKVERRLAQGEPSEGALASVQHELEHEIEQPYLLIAARGERAQVDQSMQAMEKGELDVRSLVYRAGWTGWLQQLLYQVAVTTKGTRAALLRSNTALVEIAKLPVEQQVVRATALQAAEQHIPSIFVESTFAQTRENLVAQFHRNQADLRCAVVMLAIERYLRAHNHWPDALTDLVPSYLPRVPLDPFDGAPLRYRRWDDGVVIYSIGPDGEDNGGTLDNASNKAGTDVGFRLWEVPKRRQPPKPPKS